MGSSPSAGTCGATWTISLSSSLHLAIAFERALFPGLPIGHLPSSTYFPWIYNTAEVVRQSCHLSHPHHADGQLPLQQFRRRLKLIPKPKGTYSGTEKITIRAEGHLHWGGAYIRNYMVSIFHNFKVVYIVLTVHGVSTSCNIRWQSTNTSKHIAVFGV